MKVRFLNLSVTDPDERKAFHQALDNILDHGLLVLGPEVERFEESISRYTSSPYAIGVGSGSDAIFLALKALGINVGDEVITSCMSFVATANAISLTGAKPVFADLGEDLNIDPDSIRSLITPKTKAIIPVHYGGLMADMAEIQKIADEFKLQVVEDASQAFGATAGGRYAGTLGDIGAISLNPMKILAGMGEAGIVLTANETLRLKLETLRYNGLEDRKLCRWPSTNARLDTLQAAFLQYRLEQVNDLIQKRREIASYYRQSFGHLVSCPKDIEERKHVYYTFNILTEHRDALLAHLTQNDIESKVYHPIISHEPAYKQAECRTTNANKLFAKKLAIPCHEKLSDNEVQFVVDTILQFFENHE
jgi:dTDP-4-amino-4,6-dideoxygalactose transaminase